MSEKRNFQNTSINYYFINAYSRPCAKTKIFLITDIHVYKFVRRSLTRSTRQVSHLEKHMRTRLEHLRSPRFLVEFVLISLWYFMLCFVYCCVYLNVFSILPWHCHCWSKSLKVPCVYFVSLFTQIYNKIKAYFLYFPAQNRNVIFAHHFQKCNTLNVWTIHTI